MKVQKYERRGTPLNERVRYFFEVMLWSLVTLVVLVILMVTYLEISELFVPTGAYTGHTGYLEDKRLCLELRPKSELYDCLGEYGWFDKPAVFQLKN